MMKQVLTMLKAKNFNAFYFYDKYINFNKKIKNIFFIVFMTTSMLGLLYIFLNLLVLEPLENMNLNNESFFLLSQKINNPFLKSFFSFYELALIPSFLITSLLCLIIHFKIKNKGVWLLNKIIQLDEKVILKNQFLEIDGKSFNFTLPQNEFIDIKTQQKAILTFNQKKELIQYFYPLIVFFYLKEKFRHLAYEKDLSYLNFNTITQELEFSYISNEDLNNKMLKIHKKWTSLEKIEQDFIQSCFSCLNLDNLLCQCLLNDTNNFYGFSQFEFIYQMNREQFIQDYSLYLRHETQYSMMNIDMLKWLFEKACNEPKIYQFLKDSKIYYGSDCYYYYHEHIAIIDEKIRLNEILKDPEENVIKKPRKNRKI